MIPTIHSPWYVVQKFKPTMFLDSANPSGRVVYWGSLDPDGEKFEWVDDPKKAQVSMSIQSAARIAVSVAGELRALVSKDDLDEFRPGGM